MTTIVPRLWGLFEELQGAASTPDACPSYPGTIPDSISNDKIRHPLAQPAEQYKLARGSASVYAAANVPLELLATTTLSDQMCDQRYYDVVDRALGRDFSLFYLVLRERAGAFRGAQPFFVIQQNILAGVRGRMARLAEKIRQKYPRFLTMKTLMVGNPAGSAGLGIAKSVTDTAADHRWFAEALGEALAAYSQRHKVRIVVFKDFPRESRERMAGLTDSTTEARGGNFLRIPSMPMTAISLVGYKSYEDYLSRKLSKATRKNLRRKFRATAGEKIEMTVTNDIEECVDEVYRLYLQVYNRAGMKFEKLTPRYFLELSRRMPERVRFFLWRRAGKLIAVSVTLTKFTAAPERAESSLVDLYLGMEYPLALDLHLYFVTMRDIIQWCIEHQIAMYYSTPLNYDAKLHFRHTLVPQDLYVRHTSPILNPLFQFAMRFAEPTRHDKIIRQFPNAHEL